MAKYINLETIADKIKAIGVIMAFILGCATVIYKYYSIPEQVKVISEKQDKMQDQMIEVSAKLDMILKQKRTTRK